MIVDAFSRGAKSVVSVNLPGLFEPKTRGAVEKNILRRRNRHIVWRFEYFIPGGHNAQSI
jgi:hypothetical protein